MMIELVPFEPEGFPGLKPNQKAMIWLADGSPYIATRATLTAHGPSWVAAGRTFFSDKENKPGGVVIYVVIPIGIPPEITGY